MYECNHIIDKSLKKYGAKNENSSDFLLEFSYVIV